MTDERHTPRPDRDEPLEAVLGNLLRIGVIVAAAVVGAGGVYLLSPGETGFRISDLFKTAGLLSVPFP